MRTKKSKNLLFYVHGRLWRW